MSIRRMIVRPISRRTLLRGAGVTLALPFLEAMRPRTVSAQTTGPQRFLAFFCPCGTEPSRWEPAVTDAISESDLTECLVDMAGFDAEIEWPASGPVFSDITWVTNVDHQAICNDIHNPSMALSAHNARGASPEVTPKPTLDQYLASQIQAETAYRSLTSSATGDTAITQGFLSFRENGQAEAVYRNATALFDTVFSGLDPAAQVNNMPTEIRSREASILDYAIEDATRLGNRLGAADRQRVDQYMQSVRELEQQIQNTTVTAGCSIPEDPERTRDMHTNTKLMLDLTIMAFQCDLTRVAVVQYSNSWDVNYGKYELPEGCSDWSDHFISHKLDDNDRAKDLDDVISRDGREAAMRIANARVVQTSRFKARRFANVVGALKEAPGANGSLFEETLALYCSENGDGDSHSRKRVPYMLAGNVGGFKTGRVVDAGGRPTGALHSSILGYFGIDVGEYGDPPSGPVPGL